MAKNSRSETEMSALSDTIRDEMADAVRVLGGGHEVLAKHANTRAARLTGLPITTIESLRWRKVKRVPADVYVAVRDALARHAARQEALARHEALLTDIALASAANVARGADVPGLEGGDQRRVGAGEGSSRVAPWIWSDPR